MESESELLCVIKDYLIHDLKFIYSGGIYHIKLRNLV